MKWNTFFRVELCAVVPSGCSFRPISFQMTALRYISIYFPVRRFSRSPRVCMCDSVEAKMLVSVFSKSSLRLKPITSNSMSHHPCHREQFSTVFLCRSHNAAFTHNRSVCSSRTEPWGWPTWCSGESAELLLSRRLLVWIPNETNHEHHYCSCRCSEASQQHCVKWTIHY